MAPRGRAPRLETSATNSNTNPSDHVRRRSDDNTEVQQVPRTADNQPSNDNIEYDRQYRRPPDPSGTNSGPSTPNSNSHAPWRPVPSPVQLTSSGNATHSRDHSTWCIVPASSGGPHADLPSTSEHTPPRRHQFASGPYQNSFDRTSQTSKSSSTKTKLSDLWSRFSEATSLTSLPFGKASKLIDLEIPSPFLGGHQDIFLYGSTPQHPHAGTSSQEASNSLDQDQGILLLRDETSQSINSANDHFHDLSPIKQAMQSHIPTFYVRGGAVTSGTLRGLVQFLIIGFGLPAHTRYRDTFLTACTELTTPEDLFQILSRRLSEEEHTSDDGSSTQYTIFVFIVYWLSSDCFPPNEELLYRIKFFCEEAIRRYPPLDSIAKETRQLINLKVARVAPLRASNLPIPTLKASDITPQDLAIALGLLEGDHYKALQPSDYLQHLSKSQSDRVKLYMNTNEKIKLWVIRSILYFDTASGRSQVVKFYINTAFECYSMRNFSSTAAISCALQSVLVENLKATMKTKNMSLSKKVQAKLPAIYGLIHPHSNHRGYYDALHSAATTQELDTCIPWLVVHLKELDKVVRQPLTVIVDNEHLVNFTRYNWFMDRIKEILYYTPPNLEDKRHGGQLSYLLNQLHNIDLSGALERQLSEKSEKFGTRELSRNLDENLPLVGFAPIP